MAFPTGDSSRRKLFFFAAGGEAAVEAIETFTARSWDAASFRPFGPAHRQLASLERDHLRVWAFRDTRQIRGAWRRLMPADVGLGYAENSFRVASKLLLTMYSPEVGRQLFGEQASGHALSLLAFFDGTTETEISRRDLAATLGYSAGFVPRGALFVPSEQRQSFVREIYGAPDKFVDAMTRGAAAERFSPPRGKTPRRSAEPPPEQMDFALPSLEWPSVETEAIERETSVTADSPEVRSVEVV